MPTQFKRDLLKESLKKSGPAFADFIIVLQNHGFAVSVDHYLRLYSLLNSLQVTKDLSAIKHTLCPLFATSSGQQQLFYTLFDSYFQTGSLSLGSPSSKSNQHQLIYPRQKDRRIGTRSTTLWLLGILILLLLSVGISFIVEPINVAPLTSDTVTETKNLPASQKQKEGKHIVITLQGGVAPELSFYQRYSRHIRILSTVLPFIILFLL
jgi:hypothetical protein